MQHEKRVRLGLALLERDFHPAIRIGKVARNRIPEDAGHAFLFQRFYGFLIQEVLAENAAAAERTEQPVWMGQVAELLLCLEDFAARFAFFLNLPEGHAMRHRVIADPVAFGVGPLGELAAHRIGELPAQDKERGADRFFLQDFQDMLRDPGLGPVVEGQRDLKPWHAS